MSKHDYLNHLEEIRPIQDFSTSNNYDEKFQDLYPEISKIELFRLIATYNKAYLSKLSSQIVKKYKSNSALLGAGSEELIIRLGTMLKARETQVAVVTPCFFRVSEVFPNSIEKIPFNLLWRSYLEPYSFVFITNPNPINGKLIPKSKLLNLIRKYPKTLFIIDEASIFFVPNWKTYSLLANTNDSANFIVLSSFSKMYGVPSLRVGFVSGNLKVLTELETLGPTFPVNSVASLIISKLIVQDKKILALRNKIENHKKEITLILSSIPGIKIMESKMNCIYFKIDDIKNLHDKLKSIGIVTLDLNGHEYAPKDYIRLTIHSSESKYRYLFQRIKFLKRLLRTEQQIKQK